MSVTGITRILEEYDDKCELYDLFTQRLEVLIDELLDINELNVVSVTSRLKERDNISEKVNKSKDKYSCLDDITDISGLRIITYFADDVDKVAEIIESEFEIDWENSVDKREIMQSNQFGYMSLHYIVTLAEPRASLSENIRFNECKAEIQIRSILQHAWAEIEHDLGYKTELEIPQKSRRRFTRIAGLLEVADSEFDAIRQRLAEYREEVGQRIIEEPTEVLIDKDSLTNFIETDSIIESIAVEIAQKSEHIYDITAKHGNYTDDLIEFGITKISELKGTLEDKREIIVKYAVDWLISPLIIGVIEEENDEKHKIGPEITLHYLMYVLCGDRGKNEFTLSYLINRFERLDNDPVFDRVFDTYIRLIDENSAIS